MVELREGQVKRAVVVWRKADGSAGRVDGVPDWAVSDPAVLDMAVEADGMAATITAVQEGSATISVVGDADLGAGVRHLTASADVVVLPLEATAGEISFEDLP